MVNRISWFYIFLCFVACSQKESVEVIPLKVGVTAFVGEVATFIAQEKGYFADEGLDVSIKINNSGVESMKQLLDGDLDLAHTSESPLLYALLDSTFHHAKPNSELQILANMVLSNRIQKIISRKSLGILEPKDLEGKKVALVKNSQSDYHFDSFLLENDLDRNDMTILDYTPELQKAALKNGDVDAVVVWEPHGTHLLELMPDDTFEMQTSLTYSTLWLAISLRSLEEQKPGASTRYLRSLLRAHEYIYENPEEVIALTVETTRVPESVIRKVRQEIDFYLSLSERMIMLLEWQQLWLEKKGIKQNSPIRINDYINYKPMGEVAPAAISVIR